MGEFPVHYTKDTMKLGDHSDVISVLCGNGGGTECTGAVVYFVPGETLGASHVGALPMATIQSKVGNTYTLQVAKGQTLSVDMNAGVAVFTESDEFAAFRSEIHCATKRPTQ